MQSFYLANHAYACVADDLLIVLDGRSGKYYGIPVRSASALFPYLPSAGAGSHGVDSAEPDEGSDLRATLTGKRLITTDHARGKPIAPPQIVVAGDLNSHVLAPPREIARAEAAIFLRSAALAKISLKLRSFADLAMSLQAIKNKPGFCTGDACQKLPSLLASFRTLRALTYTSRENCLYDSFVLDRFLLAHRIPATLVVAVGTRPFGAHCWVQHEGLVLNDSASHAREFTPLIAV